MRVEGPAKHQANIVDDVEDRDQPERGVVARRQIGDRKLPGERPDHRRVARKARIGRHAVAFERDPIGPHIAKIGRDDLDAAGACFFGGHDMVGPPIAVQYQVGNRMGLQHLADEGAPIVEMAAKMHCGQTPEQLIAEMQIDPMNAVAARD
jgi:hypothetical protein